MPNLPPAHSLLKTAPTTSFDVVVLDYDARLMRRKRLTTTQGNSFLVDLPAVANLDDFWGFELADGRAIQILPAEEPLVKITGDLHRLAWHIGNRHTPCQIGKDRLLIRRDHVLEAMLTQLGATLAFVTEPFTPEGGAYGTGRTMGHSHAPDPAPPPPAETFGWHDHGDGHLHFHAAKR